jgi:hypothetical protein
MPLDPDKQLKAYLELYKQQMARFHQTQEVEWKANISIWSLLAAGIYLTKDKCLDICPCLAWILVLVVVVLHFWWLRLIHKSEQVDKNFWIRYRAEALKLVRGTLLDGEGEEHGNRSGFVEFLWLVPEVGMTVLLASSLAYLATRH